MKLEDLKIGMWLEHKEHGGLIRINKLCDNATLDFYSIENDSNFSALNKIILEECKPWTPAAFDSVKVLYSFNPPTVTVLGIDNEGYYCEGEGFKGYCGLHHLEPIAPGEGEQRLEDMRSGKMAAEINESCKELQHPTYEVGDVVVVKRLGAGSVLGEQLRVKLKSVAYSFDGFLVTALHSHRLNGGSKEYPEGEVWSINTSDIIRKVKPGQLKNCSKCDNTGFTEADTIPEEIFNKGTMAILDWIDEINGPFEGASCSCHCGNPPCSKCTDTTLVEACQCNELAAGIDNGIDMLVGKTYGDTVAINKSHQDSPDGHNKFMEDLQERGRNPYRGFDNQIRGGKRGLLGSW